MTRFLWANGPPPLGSPPKVGKKPAGSNFLFFVFFIVHRPLVSPLEVVDEEDKEKRK
jgi:hypothetical protein